MKFILNTLKGIFIGAGAILPGISSGVLCVAFGIYEKLVNSVIDFFSDVKNNSKFLFPIVLGVFIGIILFGNVLNYVFSNFYNFACFTFIGLILGNFSSITKEVKFLNLTSIISFLVTFSFSIYLIVIEKSGCFCIQSNSSIVNLILAGFFMSFGVVIPRSK